MSLTPVEPIRGAHQEVNHLGELNMDALGHGGTQAPKPPIGHPHGNSITNPHPEPIQRPESSDARSYRMAGEERQAEDADQVARNERIEARGEQQSEGMAYREAAPGGNAGMAVGDTGIPSGSSEGPEMPVGPEPQTMAPEFRKAK
jgi:hypothetical protein